MLLFYSSSIVSHLVNFWREFSVSLQIHVCARVDGVFVGLLPELEREEGVLTPGNVLLHLDLILGLGEVSKTLAADGPQVHLGKEEEEKEINIIVRILTIINNKNMTSYEKSLFSRQCFVRVLPSSCLYTRRFTKNVQHLVI